MRMRGDVTVGAAITAFALISCGGSGDGGPFGVQGAAYGWSTGVAINDVFTDGLTVLQNQLDRPVRIVDVRMESGEPGLELVGVKIAGLERAIGAHQLLPGFPPEDASLGPLADPSGYMMPSDDQHATKGVELLLGIRKVVPGRATRTAVLVTYEIDGQRDVARIASTLAVCEPERKTSCPGEDGED